MKYINLKIKYIDSDKFHPTISYQTSGAAGFDLFASEDICIHPGDTSLIPTGIAVQVPEGYELQIRPRSGMSLKTKLRVANSPGTIDSDYRGEIKIIMTNTETYDIEGIEIKKGDRIAQAILCPVSRAWFDIVESLDDTERGVSGFGSTGTK